MEKYVENKYQVFETIRLVFTPFQPILRHEFSPNTAELKDSQTIEQKFERVIKPIEQLSNNPTILFLQSAWE